MANDKPSGGSHISIRGRNQMFSHSNVRKKGSRYEIWIGTGWVPMRESSPLTAGIRKGKYKLKGDNP